MKPDSSPNDSSENQGNSPDSSTGNNNTGFLQKMLTGVMFAVAFVAMIFIKPAQYLKRQVYDQPSTGGPAWFFGILASMAAGIATGYPLWLAKAAITTWVPLALASVVATYYYLWPALYMAIFRWAFQSSRFLWRNVPNASDSRSTSNPVWFSQLLNVAAIAATVLCCLYEAWTIGNALYAWLAWSSALGSVVAFAISVVVGGGAAWITGFVVITIITQVGMPALAVASGAALAWWYDGALAALVQQYELPHSLTYALQAAVVFVVASYVFPLAHVAISRGLNFVGKYIGPLIERFINGFFDAFGRFLDGFYNDHDSKYVNFLHQVVGIAITYGVGSYVYGWSASFGLPAAVALTAVVALIGYLAIGSIVSQVSNMFIGVAGSIAAAAAVVLEPSLQVFSGWFFVGVQAVLTALLAGLVVIPLAYRAVKFVANPLLASWLSEPLTNLHRSLRRELLSANSNTYSDKTGFETLFAHLVNITAAVAGFFAVNLLLATLAIGGWMALVMPIATVVFAYLFLGKLLLRYGNHLIGGIVGLAVGVFVGVEVFAHQGQNYWYAIPSFAVAAGLTAAVVFPVLYVLFRALVNAVRGMSWLLPVVGGVYDFFFGFVAKVWTQFLVVYKRLEASFVPVWRRLSQTWDESWESAMAAINKAWNQTKK
ncbi:MAG: hypothetical protein WC028_24030 [Candidatus Obscuribacterales bacterium]